MVFGMRDFCKKFFLLQKWESGPKVGFSRINLYYLYVSLYYLQHKSHIREKTVPEAFTSVLLQVTEVCQNSLSQLDCRIFKSTVSQEKTDEMA